MLINTRRNKSGFTLLEIAISIALLVVVTYGVVELVDGLMQGKAQVSNTTDADSFVSSLAKWLQTQPGCDSTLDNLTLNSTASPLAITGYSGFGLQSGTIQNNFSINSQLIIKSMTIKDKGLQGVNIPIAGVTYQQKIAQIVISFESQVGQSVRELHQRVIELPVLLSGNTISQCHLSSNMAESCSVMGGTYSGGICTPATFCQLQGTYTTVSCSPSDPNCPAPTLNPFTGGQSCPTGTVAAQTGQFNDVETLVSNKGKNTTNINVSVTYFMCQLCSSLGTPCTASTNNNCSLNPVGNGGSSGTCVTGTTGNCSYACVNGNWQMLINTCQ